MSMNWAKIVQKYTGVGSTLIPEDVRKDVLALVGYARAQFQENTKLFAELEGARKTMLALCVQAGGSLDVPFELVDQLTDDDVLRAEDIEVPGLNGPVKIKRFTRGSKAVVIAMPKVH